MRALVGTGHFGMTHAGRSRPKLITTLLKTAAVLFVLEFAVMRILSVLGLPVGFWQDAADSLMLAILALPALYVVGFRPRDSLRAEDVRGYTRTEKRVLFLLLAYVAVVLLLVGAQSFLMAGQESASAVINLAGRQRMLSQYVAREALHWREENDNDPLDAAGHLENIGDKTALFERVLAGLRDGDAELDLPPCRDPAARQKLVQVGEAWATLRMSLPPAAHLSERRDIEVLADATAEVLAVMDDAVGRLQVYYEGRAATLYTMQGVFILAGGLIGLLLVVSFVQMVAQRRRLHSGLVDSEAQVRLLLNSTAEAIYRLDLQGNCVFCNPACLRLLGYQDERELLGKNMHDLIHHTRPDGTQYAMEECRIYQAFRQGEGTHVDDEVLWRADGSSFPAEYWSYPIHQGDEVTGSVVTFLDITERKRAEERLHFQNRVFRDLHSFAASESSDVVAFCDRVVTVMAGIFNVSDVIIEWTTPTEIEVVSMWTQGEIVHGGRFPLAGTPCENVYQDCEACHHHGPLKDLFPEDEFFRDHPMQAYAGAPWLDSDGNVLGILNVMNVDERPFSVEELRVLQIFAQFVGSFVQRKRAEDALRRAHDELEERVQERTSSLATANVRLEEEIAERRQAEEKANQAKTAAVGAHNKLEGGIAELREFNRLAVGRELRMIELKDEVNKLSDKAGLPPPHDLAFDRLESAAGGDRREGPTTDSGTGGAPRPGDVQLKRTACPSG